MRPLCVHMDNFCSYRGPTSVALHDVDYFVLVGPTGSGKSTVIDAICFALYGTVPRWSDERKVSLALAPSAASGRVALVFEVAGRRYGVVRALARSARGAVTTKEARLDELDPAVDPAEGVEALLASPVRTIADGDGVTAAAQRLTGLEYRFFTQCVILPQGRFAEFLQAKPRDRQDLLVQLLDAATFESVMKRAGEEGKAAAARAEVARAQLGKLAGATEAAEAEAAARLERLRALEREVRSALDALASTEVEMRETEEKARESRGALDTLTKLAMPPYVPTLTEDLRDAAGEAGRLAGEATRHEEAESGVHERLAGLGDKSDLRLALEAHRKHAELTATIATGRAALETAETEAAEAAGEVVRARAALRRAEDERQHARDAHAAADLARRLSAGDPCPVCAQTVTEVPRHASPAALEAAEENVRTRSRDLDTALAGQQERDRASSRIEARLAALERQLESEAERVRAHPDASDAEARLTAITAAEKEVAETRERVRQARTAAAEAAKRHEALQDEADGARSELHRARDTVVAFGAPPLDPSSGLHTAWTALLAWRDQETTRRRRSAEALRAELDAARDRRSEQRDALAATLAEHSVATHGWEPEAVRAAVQDARNQAASHLETVRADRRNATALAKEVAGHEQDARVAHALAVHLRANNFENWLCGEALDLLVTAASETLLELSDGRFELDLDPKNAIEVIDRTEAGMRRSVRTLSGGETFQASLALALALSEQVARFGGGAARGLDSIFLDEGFGTLDPETLDTVATTLERLAATGDRMVGIVTHVPALAERVPVRFDVVRDAAGSHVEKKVT